MWQFFSQKPPTSLGILGMVNNKWIVGYRLLYVDLLKLSLMLCVCFLSID